MKGMDNAMKKPIIAVIIPALLLSLGTAAFAAAAPVNVERRNVDGVAYIVKTYETAPGTAETQIVEDDFEDGGFQYTLHTVASEDKTSEETKEVTEMRTAESESKELSEVLKKFPSALPFEADGFTGSLVLDAGSILTEAAGYTTYMSTISDTREYFGMMYADAAQLPQSVVKNGATLPLADVSWTVTGTSLAGDSLVPSEYKATAVYSKKVSSQAATGYVSTAIYRGEVSRSVVDSVVFTITYIGTPIAAPEPEPEPEPEIAAAPFPWGALVKILALLLLLGGGVFGALYWRSRQGVQVFNLMERDYLCIGRQRLDAAKPVIDLNAFGDVIQSAFFSFVLDAATTKRLFGRNIAVTLGDITVNHQVRELKGPYRFNLEMGEQSDA
jgi:hypothetical protein